MSKVLLITGGTGSFGQAVLNKFLKNDVFENIRIFSRDEKKQDDIRKMYNDPKLSFLIGDVRYPEISSKVRGIQHFFSVYKSLIKFFPMQAVQTNIMGADNVLNSAKKHNVEKAIVLSTDKAVYPINAMGLSKAMMEKVMVARSRNSKNTIMCGTRYGNVMGSRGSVIPLFIEQIKKGNELTITDPEMTRFMMSLDEAVELVLYAFENGKSGDIFVQKSPAATIDVLAKALLKLYEADNPLKIIGTRHGEKLYETLVNREEMLNSSDLGGYFRIHADNRNLNYDSYFSKGDKHVSDMEEYNSHNTQRLNVEETIEILKKLPFVKADLGL